MTKKNVFFDPTFPSKTAIKIFNVNYLITSPVLFYEFIFLHVLEVREPKKKIKNFHHSPIPPKITPKFTPLNISLNNTHNASMSPSRTFSGSRMSKQIIKNFPHFPILPKNHPQIYQIKYLTR